MDLIRELLLKLEEFPKLPTEVFHITPDSQEVVVPGYSYDQLDYHISLICEAGFIDEGATSPMVGICFRSLTWEGHDFLDSIRDPEIWSQTKEGVKKAGGFSLELLSALAKGLIKKKIEEHTGIQI